MKFISKVSQHLTDWFSDESVSGSVGIATEIELQSLEDRVLYSAAPVPLDLVSEPTVDANFEQVDQQLDFLADAVEQLQNEGVDDGQMRLDENEYSLDAVASDTDPAQDLRELVILDKGVEGWEALYEDVVANNTSGTVTVRLIETNEDGVEAVTRILEELGSQGTSLSALHIVSHGDRGEVQLGNAVLSSDSIVEYSHEISQWNDSLAYEADILIYGCDLAGDANGESLVEEISSLAGANVAASDDLTGQADSGGDWILEFTTGTIDSDTVFSVSIVDSWNHTLSTASPVPSPTPITDGPQVDDSTVYLSEFTPVSTSVFNLDDTVSGSDFDQQGDPINYTLANDGGGLFSIDPNTGEIILVAPLDYEADTQHVLTVDASDGVFSDVANVTVIVENENEFNPVVDDSIVTLVSPANGDFVVDMNDVQTGVDQDLDGDAVTYQILGGNDAGIFGIDSSTGIVSVVNNAAIGSTTQQILTIEASDGSLADTASVVVNLSTSNDAPVANDSTQSGLENYGVRFEAIDFGFSDLDGDVLKSIRIESLPALGQLHYSGTALTQAELDANPGGIEVLAENIGQLRYVGPIDVFGQDVASFQFGVSDGQEWSAVPANMSLSLGAEERLWVSTAGDSTSKTSIPGDGSGSLQFGGPTLGYGENTAGHWSEQFAPEGFIVDALHYVDTNIQIGSTSSVNLNRGDILFSSGVSKDAGGPQPGDVATVTDDTGMPLQIRQGDIVRFRPTAGDYSDGNYEIVVRMENLYGSVPADFNLNAFALIEQDSIVGDRLLNAGDLLIADSTSPNDIVLLELDSPGDTSTGTLSLLVSGADIGVDGALSGLDLIEATTSAGGQVLSPGSILASVEAAESVGENGLAVEAHDVFVLDVASTSYSGQSEATATVFFDGSDVGGDATEPDTAIDAVSLLGSPDMLTPVLIAEPTTLSLQENEVKRFEASDFVSNLSEANLTSIAITSLPNSANGVLTFRGEAVVVGQAIAAEDLGLLVFQPTLDHSFASDFFEYRASSGSEVLPANQIPIQVAPVADDLLIGNGTELHAFSPSDMEVVAPDGFDRIDPHVAPLADGGYVVAWHVETTTESAIQLQRYDANHNMVGGLIDFTDDAPGTRSLPSVAGLSDGGFVAMATRQASDGSDVHVFVTRYDAAGNKVLLESTADGIRGNRLDFDGIGGTQDGDIVGLQGGGFAVAVVEESLNRVVGKVFHEGEFIREFQLSDSIAGADFENVVLAPTKQGGFVAAWTESRAFIGSVVKVQFYDVNGFETGPVTTVGNTRSVDAAASISVLKNNEVVVVWGESTTGNPAGDHALVAAVVNENGSISSAGEVFITYDSKVFDPDVVALNDGGFLIVASDASLDSSSQSIAAHRFDSDFVAVGNPKVINASMTGSQSSPQLALLEGSDEVVAVWNTEVVGGSVDVVSNAYLFSSMAPAGDRIPLSFTVAPQAGASEVINNVELTGVPVGAKVFATETASGTEVELVGPTVNLNAYDLETVELLLPLGTSDAEMLLSVTVTDGGGSEIDTHRVHASTVDVANKTISGTVFNDENADGLVHDASGFDGVTVRVYREFGGAYVETMTTTTDADGYYEFTGVGEGTFFVVVDSTTIGSDVVEGSDAIELATNQNRVWAEQTFGGDGSIRGGLGSTERAAGFMFGGRFAARSDDATSLVSAEHVNRQVLAVGDSGASNVDFGFSFNAVVNVEDAFDNMNAEARTVQGSMRQFLQNANLVSGDNGMKFVPAVSPNATATVDGIAGTTRWWSINVVHELPDIVTSGVVVDGQAFRPTYGGLEERDLNDFSVQNSFTGTVGANDLAFVETDAPELELVGNSSIAHGILINADMSNPGISNIEVANLSVHGFGNAAFDAVIRITGEDIGGGVLNLTDVTISNNVLGSSPNDIVAGVDSRTAEDYRGVYVTGSSDGLISNNIIVGNTTGGIRLDGFRPVHNWVIEDNEIGDNGTNSTISDGVDATNTSAVIVRRNAIYGNAGMGVDEGSSGDGSGNWLVEDNSIYDNGFGADYEGSGVRLTGDGSVVKTNYIYDNQFDGVTVAGYYNFSTNSIVPAVENLISQNRFQSNGELDIDLMTDVFDGLRFQDYDDAGNSDGFISVDEAYGPLLDYFDFVANAIVADDIIDPTEHSEANAKLIGSAEGEDLLDDVSNSNTANNGLDAPVITEASFDFDDLNVTVAITNGDVQQIELYTIKPGDTDSTPEAWQYFKTVPLSSMTYVDSVNLTNPSATIPAERYSFTLPASDFPSGVPRDTPIVALAIDGVNNTSEIGQAATPTFVNHAPEAFDGSISIQEDVPHVFSIGEFTFSDPDLDEITDLIITSLPSGGQLLFGGNPVAANQSIDAALVGNLSFVPDPNFSSVSTFGFAVSDGTLNSLSATMSIDVNNVPDAPVAADRVLAVAEDGVFDSFDMTTLGFGDPDDAGLNSLVAVEIVSFSGSGTLTTNSGDAAGETLTIAQLGELEYRPAANDNGNGIAEFEFRVIDDGVGDNVSGSHKITFDVAPVSDNPTGVSRSVEIKEDELVTFNAASFGFVDAADGDAFAGVRIVGFTGSGSLQIDGSDVAANTLISVADLPRLRFQPGAHESGQGISTISFQVVDDSVTNNEDLTVRTLQYNVVSVSDNPVGADGSETIDEDSTLSFSKTTFGFSDPYDDPADGFKGVRIVSFSGSGTLQLNGTDVIANEVIPANRLGGLEYTPAANENGVGIATIQFRVIDGGDNGNNVDTEVRELSINVNSIGDAPVGVSDTLSVVEDGTLGFNQTTFGFADPVDESTGTGNLFDKVRIVDFTGSGALTLNGTSVVNNQEITTAELADLQYQPAANQNGAGLATIEFRVIDDAPANNEDLQSRFLSIDVVAASDAPVGASGSTSIEEDAVLNFDETTFGFSDPLDTPADSFAGVRIVSFAGGGSLELNGIAVSPNQVITAAQLPNLVYQPPVDGNGNGIATIQFRVIDSGTAGSQVDTTVRELTIDVTPVADNPIGVSDTFTINEDQPASFTAASFGFADVDGDQFAGVRIVGFAGSGVLELNGSAVSPSQFIPVAELANLVYQPGANTNGTGMATIDFRVVDNGASNTEDVSTRTLTYDITPQHDAPTGQSDIVSVVEDGVLGFTQSMFGFSDAIDNNTDSFDGVRIVAFSGNGTLTLNGTAVAANTIVSPADLANLEYRPVPNASGVAEAAIDFRVIDSGATDNEDLTLRVLTIDVTAASDAPVGQDGSVTIDEDAVLNFDETTFGFSDPLDNDAFAGVRIVSFAGSGTLELNGIAVSANQIVTATDLPFLEYQPVANQSGNDMATIRFRVIDDGDAGSRVDTTVRELAIHVTPIADNPTGVTQTVPINEDQPVSFTPSSFGFLDVNDGDAFAGVRIVAFNGSGTLTLNGATVNPNDVITAAALPFLEFTPAANANGSGLATIAFRVIDSGTANNEDLTDRSLTYDVSPVSDAPVGQDDTVTVNEDSVLTFDQDTFGFSDPIDGGADSFAGVRIVSFSGSGTLTLGGTVVVPNQDISSADLGLLEYRPAANEYGTSLANIQFQVIDTGSPGSDVDETVRVLTIDVAPISDAPVGSSTTTSVVEDGVLSFDGSTFGFADPVDNNVDVFKAVRIVNFDGSGSLTLNGATVNPNDVISSADLANLEYRPAADQYGASMAFVDFRVIDSGVTNFESVATERLTIDVTAQHDAPVGNSSSVAVDEDGVLNFDQSTFGFSDPVDNNVDVFNGVRIVSFTGGGTLTLNGATVSANEVVSAVDLPNLEYRPAANENGNAVASIDYRVVDSGLNNNEDATTRTLTIDVTSIGDAPVGSDGTLTTTEDTSVNLEESLFAFSDPIDNGEHSLAGVEFVSFSGSGTLTLNGVTVGASQFVSVADLPNVQYSPGANENGDGIASIQFRVVDDAINGVQSDVTVRELAINVTPVSDHPEGATQTLTISEDQPVSFDESSFGFVDAADGNAFAGVRIVGLTGSGSLTINGLDVSPGAVVSAANIDQLQFQPGLDEFGTGISTIEFRVLDDAAVNNEDLQTRTLTYDVTAVSDAPTGVSQTVAFGEDSSYTFDLSSFGFSDVDGDSLAGVRIVALNGPGELTLNGVPVTPGTVVAPGNVGQLVYTPLANEYGNAYASVDFRVVDDSAASNEDLSDRTLTFDVLGQDDYPTGQSQNVGISEDETVTFTENSFGYAAVDGTPFGGVRIVGFSGSGTLQLNGADVAANTVVSAAQLPGLVYQPGADENGISLSQIQFRVLDNSLNNNEDINTQTLTYDVLAEHDAPVGESNRLTVNEDALLSFDQSVFGFSDAIDNDVDTFESVRIVSFAGSGTLLLNGATVNANDVVSVADLGNLEYRAPANQNGDGLATIEFRVIDSGTTDNEDVVTRTLTIDVTPVSDNPVGQSNTVTIDEDSVLTFDETTFGFSDPVDNGADSFSGVRIVSFSGSGALTLDGVAVAANEVVSTADLARLQYRPAANENGAGLASIQFRVIDSGALGGQVDLTVRDLTINVDPVGEAPVGTSETISLLEDSEYIFDLSSFGFSDVDGDSFGGVRIVGFSGSGTLTLNGVDVAVNEVVPVAEIGNLLYQPGANENGASLAELTFRVIDDGVSNNEDIIDRSLTFDVVPQNDLPVGASQTITIQEDETVTFTHQSFGYQSVDGDPMAGVRIVGFSGSGTLTLNGFEILPNTEISAGDLSNLVYQPGANEYGDGLSQIEFRVIDGSTSNDESADSNTLTFDVVEVNDAPSGTSGTLTTLEDQPLGFAPEDFGFDDSADNGLYQFDSVRIMDFMGGGTLLFNGNQVMPGQIIPVSELGALEYLPIGNDNGFGLATIAFRVFDNGNGFNEDTTTKSLTIDVIPQDDAPTGQSNTITITENEPFTFNGSDFGFSDADDLVPNDFAGVRIVGVNGSGTLTLNGADVVVGAIVDVADISQLEFNPGADQSGDAIASVEFRVLDDGSADPGEANEDQQTRVITFNVLNVNDAPEVEGGIFTNVENAVVSHAVSVFDIDGDSVSLSLVGTNNDNSLFEVGPDGQSIQFVVGPDYENPQSIEGANSYFVDVQAVDVHGSVSEIERIEVQVLNVDESIQLEDDRDLFVVGGSSGTSVLANDNQGQPFPQDAVFEVLTQPDSGTVLLNEDGTFEFLQSSVTLESDVEFVYTVESGGEVTQANVQFKQAGGAPGNSATNNGSSGSSTTTTEESNSVSINDDIEIDKDAIDSSLVQDSRREGPLFTRAGNSGPSIIPNNSGSGADTLNNDINDAQFSIDSGIANAASLYTSYAYAKFVDTSLLSTELATRVGAAAKAGIQEFTEDFAFAAAFWEELDSASQNYVHADVGEIEAVIVAGGLVTSVAVGIFARTALLVGSIGAAYANPWWNTFDILPLIKDEEEESIEQIVDNDDDQS